MPKDVFLVKIRDIHICVLWDMNPLILSCLDINFGLRDPFGVQWKFASFPNASYKCKQIGHFARNCSSNLVPSRPSKEDLTPPLTPQKCKFRQEW